MKKIVSTLLAAAMALSLSTTVFADDGTQSTALTVHVTPGTYTVSVPESLSVNTADFSKDGSSFYFEFKGESQQVSVKNVQNCRIVNCEVTAPTLATEDGTTLDSSLKVFLINPLAPLENWPFYGSDSISISPGESCVVQPYQKNRMDETSSLNTLTGKYELTPVKSEYGRIELYIYISEETLGSADPGSYTGNVTFRFFSSNTLPTTSTE